MADIRIKDLATTATTTASDDFMAVDGATNGTRKLSAATPAFLTSVTTPSLTSPAAIALTLGTTDSGAAITVLAASNNVGIGTTSPNVLLHVLNSGALDQAYEIAKFNNTDTTYGLGIAANYNSSTQPKVYIYNKYSANSATSIEFGFGATYGAGQVMTLKQSGTVSIPATTGGAANAGALVLQGGISAGNSGSAESYFGGDVVCRSRFASNTSHSFSALIATGVQLEANSTWGGVLSGYGTTNDVSIFNKSGGLVLSVPTGTTAVTFGGAVSITGNIGFYGQAATAKPTGVAVTAAAIHAALVTLNLIAA